MDTARWRVRWVAVGAVVVLGLGGAGVALSGAPGSVPVSSGERGVFVSVVPCRLFDTRPAPDTVGSRSTPLGAGETYVQQVTGVQGRCVVPEVAVGVAMNVSVLQGTASSFLTVFPADVADVDRPVVSSVNWAPGSGVKNNKVDVRLSADGALKLFNKAGTVHVIADVVGYYADHDHDDRYYTQAEVDAIIAADPGGTVLSGSGPPDGHDGVDGDFWIDLDKWVIFGPKVADAWPEPVSLVGPQGAVGPQGLPGTPAPRPARVVWVATSGGDFTTVAAALASITDASPTNRYLVRIAPGTYSGAITLKDWVDIEGSGRDLTTIRGPVSMTARAVYVPAGAHTALRRLRVDVVGEVLTAIGVEVAPLGGAAPGALELSEVDIVMPTALTSLGVVSAGTPLSIDRSSITVDGLVARAVEMNGGMASITDSTLTSSADALVVTGDATTVRDSVLSGFYAVHLGGTGSANIAHTQVNGSVIGTPACVGAYDAGYSPLNSACAEP